MAKIKRWTEKEIVFLKNNYEKFGITEVAKELNRSYYSVRKRAQKLGLNFKNKTWKEEIEFVISNQDAIVTYADIIKTFNQNQQKLAFDYVHAKEFRKRGLKLKEISNQLKIPEATLRQWSSKTTPRAIKEVIKLTKLGLLPLLASTRLEFKLFLKIYGWIFGDGHLNSGFSQIVFAGSRYSIGPLEEEIKSAFPFLKQKSKTVETNGNFQGRNIVGKADVLVINDAAFLRLLYAAGAPIGNKVTQPIEFPEWLFNLDSELKATFIGALWSTDGTKPIWSKNGFHFSLQFNKTIKFKKEHELFLNSIRKLMGELGIETGTIKWKKKTYTRKDGEVVGTAYFYVSAAMDNFSKFYERIPIFNLQRRNEFQNTFNIVKGKMRKRDSRRQMFLYAKELSKNGKSIKEVSRELNMPYSTTKVWIRGLHKPV